MQLIVYFYKLIREVFFPIFHYYFWLDLEIFEDLKQVHSVDLDFDQHREARTNLLRKKKKKKSEKKLWGVNCNPYHKISHQEHGRRSAGFFTSLLVLVRLKIYSQKKEKIEFRIAHWQRQTVTVVVLSGSSLSTLSTKALQSAQQESWISICMISDKCLTRQQATINEYFNKIA